MPTHDPLSAPRPATGPTNARRGRWRFWLIAAALAALALLIGHLVAWWLASARLSRVEAALAADGAPSDIASLLGPAPAAADDGGRDWSEAIAGLVIDPPADTFATRDGLARAALDPVSAQARCARHRQRLELFARGSARPTVRLPIDWTQEDLRLPHLASLRFLARLTLVRGAAAWGEDPQRGGPLALAAIATVRAAAHRLGEEPTLLSNLSASAMEGEALHLVWLISWDPAVVTCDLAPLRAALARPSPIPACRTGALDGERILFGRRIQTSTPFSFNTNQAQGADRAFRSVCWWLYLSPLLAPLRISDQAYYLETMRGWRVRPDAVTGQAIAPDASDRIRSFRYPVSHLALPNLAAFIAHDTVADLERQVALAAIDSIAASRAQGRLTPAADLPPHLTAELTAGSLKLQAVQGSLSTRRWVMGALALQPPPQLSTGVGSAPPIEPSGASEF